MMKIKSFTIAAALIAGTTSFALAQNPPPSGNTNGAADHGPAKSPSHMTHHRTHHVTHHVVRHRTHHTMHKMSAPAPKQQ